MSSPRPEDDPKYRPHKPRIPEPVQPLLQSFQQQQLRRLMKEKATRECESLRLYEPLPKQQEFHKSRAPEVIIYGSNRGGKTTAAMVELARAVTGQDQFNKYPKENGRVAVVAKDQKHIATVFHAKLFRAMCFKMIRDEATGKWRAFRRHDDRDLAREKEAKWAPPLIPSRFIKEMAWENKKEHVPSTVTLVNGWEMTFYTANSDPPQGVDLDLVLFDEEIDNPMFYPECTARLGDRHGRFIWSATPQTGTDRLLSLHHRAIKDRSKLAEGAIKEPSIEEFFLSIEDNTNYPREELEKLKVKFANDPDEYKVRILGEFNVVSYLVYPSFSMTREAHGIEPFDIPADWNLWMAVDPGKTVCAALFFAVPPPHHPLSKHRFIWDEVYIRNANAEIFAEKVAAKAQGRRFTGFLIDPSSTRQDILAGGPSVLAQYARCLEHKDVKSDYTGSSFETANNDKMAGITRVESWLYHVDGSPKLKVFEGRCPNLVEEMGMYRRRKIAGVIDDKPVDRNDHACDALRYFVMRDPSWNKLPDAEKKYPVYDAYQNWLGEARKYGNHAVNFGNVR